MTYEQFVQEIEAELRKLTGEGVRISVYTALKNNGFQRKGICFSEEGSNVSPTIYLEEFYDSFQKGTGIERLARQLLEVYRKVRPEHAWEGGNVLNFEDVRGKIIYKLVNRERNEELLKQAPYVPYLDLAVVFYVMMDVNRVSERMATLLVKQEQLDWWQVTEETIHELAVKNTEKLLPYEFSAMCLIVDELAGFRITDEQWQELRDREFMYVLTNRLRCFGASALLYPGRLEMLGAYFKENYFVLPSSVHEVIVVPESRAVAKEAMNGIVREVNAAIVQEEDFLSDHAYYYDREQGALIM